MKYNVAKLANNAQRALDKYEEAIAELREALAERLESTDYLYVEHKISGRMHTDELKIDLAMSNSTYSGTRVEGTSLVNIVPEFMNRRGFDSVEHTKQLPRPGHVKEVEAEVDEYKY